MPGVMVDLQQPNRSRCKTPHGIGRGRSQARGVAGEPGRDGPELGGMGLACAHGAWLDIISGIELGLGDGGRLLGLGQGAAVLGLDGPKPAAVVGVRSRRPLYAERHLRHRSHW